MRQGLIALSLALSCATAYAANRPTDRAVAVLVEYQLAVQHDDIPAFVRLADPNMRALIERGSLRKDDTASFIDTVAGQPVRVVRTPKGVVYLGWLRQHCARCEWNLVAVVVGEGRSISKYSELSESAGTNFTTDWQVSVLAGHESWRLAHVWNATDEAPVNAALAKIDDALLAAWYFEGSIDARHDILRRLGTHF